MDSQKKSCRSIRYIFICAFLLINILIIGKLNVELLTFFQFRNNFRKKIENVINF